MPISRGTIPVKKTPKIPECPVHDAPLVFEAERGLWHCEQLKDGKKCKVTARPKQEGRDGRLVLGRGKLDLQMVLPEDINGEPRFVLVSSDNVALDITDIVLDGFQDMGRMVRSKTRRILAGTEKAGGSPVRVEEHAVIRITVSSVSLIPQADANKDV